MVSRRHRSTGEFAAASLTMPIGSTLAETRRQMILKTFASHGADYARTAKTLGVSVAEVRAELMSMIERRTGDAPAEPEAPAAPQAETPAEPAAPPAPTPQAVAAARDGVRLPEGAAPVVGKAAKAPVAAAATKGKKGQ
jgi:hypothetical protein